MPLERDMKARLIIVSCLTASVAFSGRASRLALPVADVFPMCALRALRPGRRARKIYRRISETRHEWKVSWWVYHPRRNRSLKSRKVTLTAGFSSACRVIQQQPRNTFDVAALAKHLK